MAGEEGGKPMTRKQAFSHIATTLEHEIIHVAQIEAARRIYNETPSAEVAATVMRYQKLDEAPGEKPAFMEWLEAHYGPMWDGEFDELQQAAALKAYGRTLEGQPDWKKALETIRMAKQLTGKSKTISEAILRHLEKALEVLREFVKNPGKVIAGEIENIRAVLEEFGYEQGAVKPEKAKKQARKPKTPAKESVPALEQPDRQISAPEGAETTWQGGDGATLPTLQADCSPKSGAYTSEPTAGGVSASVCTRYMRFLSLPR